MIYTVKEVENMARSLIEKWNEEQWLEEKNITEGFEEWRSRHHWSCPNDEITRHTELCAFHAGARWQQRRK